MVPRTMHLLAALLVASLLSSADSATACTPYSITGDSKGTSPLVSKTCIATVAPVCPPPSCGAAGFLVRRSSRFQLPPPPADDNSGCGAAVQGQVLVYGTTASTVDVASASFLAGAAVCTTGDTYIQIFDVTGQVSNGVAQARGLLSSALLPHARNNPDSSLHQSALRRLRPASAQPCSTAVPSITCPERLGAARADRFVCTHGGELPGLC